MKILSILLLGSLSVACVTGYNPTYYFNEVQAVNLSGATIEDVKIIVVDSNKILSCEEVAKHAMCSDLFNRHRYPQQGVELSWNHPDGKRKSEVFNPAIPVTYNSAFPLRIVMEIRKDGTVKIFYEQEEPRGAIFDS